MTSANTHEPKRDEPLLTSVAESIGATLGAIAAQANALTTAIRKRKPARKISSRKRAAKRAKAKTGKNGAKKRVIAKRLSASRRKSKTAKR